MVRRTRASLQIFIRWILWRQGSGSRVVVFGLLRLIGQIDYSRWNILRNLLTRACCRFNTLLVFGEDSRMGRLFFPLIDRVGDQTRNDEQHSEDDPPRSFSNAGHQWWVRMQFNPGRRWHLL